MTVLIPFPIFMAKSCKKIFLGRNHLFFLDLFLELSGSDLSAV